jgi:hypothetical protein
MRVGSWRKYDEILRSSPRTRRRTSSPLHEKAKTSGQIKKSNQSKYHALQNYSSKKIKIFCRICLEHCDLSSCITISCSSSHQYCQECLVKYIQHQIENGSTTILCPEFLSCSGFIHQNDLKRILSSTNYEKLKCYQKYRMNQQCPFCSHALSSKDDSSSLISCSFCGESSCLYHSNAHPPFTTCLEYEQNLKEIDHLSYQLIERISQRCPSCQFPTQKISGCDSMRCSICKKVSNLSPPSSHPPEMEISPNGRSSVSFHKPRAKFISDPEDQNLNMRSLRCPLDSCFVSILCDDKYLNASSSFVCCSAVDHTKLFLSGTSTCTSTFSLFCDVLALVLLFSPPTLLEYRRAQDLSILTKRII